MFHKKNLPMKSAFCSGSMALLTSINTGNYCLIPTNSAVGHYYGPGYLGHLYNIKQHIQFVKYIKESIDLPADHLPRFLNAYSGKNAVREGKFESPSFCEEKLVKIRNEFMKQEVYIFQISSLDIYEKDGLQVMHELVEGVEPRKQTAEEFEADVKALLAELPADAKVVFVGPAIADAIATAADFSVPLAFSEAEDAAIINTVLNAVTEGSKTMKAFDTALIIRKGGEQVFTNGELTTMGRGLLFIMLYETCIMKIKY